MASSLFYNQPLENAPGKAPWSSFKDPRSRKDWWRRWAQKLTVVLRVVPEVYRDYLPLIMRW